MKTLWCCKGNVDLHLHMQVWSWKDKHVQTRPQNVLKPQSAHASKGKVCGRWIKREHISSSCLSLGGWLQVDGVAGCRGVAGRCVRRSTWPAGWIQSCRAGCGSGRGGPGLRKRKTGPETPQSPGGWTDETTDSAGVRQRQMTPQLWLGLGLQVPDYLPKRQCWPTNQKHRLELRRRHGAWQTQHETSPGFAGDCLHGCKTTLQ